MKTKLLAIVLSLLCLIQPVMAVGMVGVESAQETASYVEAQETADLSADYSSNADIIFREDFDGYTEGQDLAGSEISYVKSGFNVGAFGALRSSTYTAKGATFNGRKVVKFTGVSDTHNMVEMSLPNLPLWGEGTYSLSIDYYLEPVATQGHTWVNFGAWHAQGGFPQTNIADAVKIGEWNTVTISYNVVADGQSFSITAKNPAGASNGAFTNTAVPGYTPGYTTSAAGDEITYYVDNVTWKKGEPIQGEPTPDPEPDPEPEPEPDVTSGVILSEDFETVAADFTTANTPGFTVNKTTFNTTFGKGDVGQGTVVTVEGNKVMRVAGNLGKWNNIGIRFNNLPITEVGKYELSFKANRQIASGYEDIQNWRGYHMNLNTGAATYNNTTAVNDGEWVTYKETFEIAVVDGAKTVTWTRANGGVAKFAANDNGITDHFYMIVNGQGEAATCPDDKIPLGTEMVWYLDDIVLTYEAPEVPEVLDESIILRENFEKASADWTYENNTFSYDASKTSAKATFVNTDRTGASATMSAVVDTSANADANIASNGTKAFMLKNRVNNYSLTGFSIKNLPLEKVGNYELSFKSFAVDVTDVNLRSISTFIGSEGGYVAPVLGEWVTYKTAITVTETDGVKTADIATREGKKYSLTLNNGVLDTNMQFIWIGDNTKTEGYYTIYIDDIFLTYEEPAVLCNITFADEEGFAFDYTAEATGKYVLPTAAMLGLAYEPVFTYGDKAYYAGETVELEKGVAEVEIAVAKSAVIFKASGAETPDVAVGEAADAKVGGTVKNGAYECNYSDWGANIIATDINIGAYGTYTFDFDVINSGNDSFAVHTMLYNSTSDGDGVTSIAGTVVNNGTNHLTHSVTIYEKNGAPYFKDRTGAEHPLDKFGYFPIARAVAMGAGGKSGTFYVDNYTISFAPTAPEAIDLVSYRVADENGKGGPAGMRFASFVTDVQIEAATEYGFIVTLKDSITTDGVADYDKVNLSGVTADRTSAVPAVNADGVKVLAGAAYNDTVNKIYTKDGSVFSNGTVSYQGVFETFFTGVLYGIPAGQEDTVFIARPYIVVDGVFYYGNCVERSYNQILAAAGV